MVSKENTDKGVVVIHGRKINFNIPVKFLNIFKKNPRFIFKREEWIGVHPLDPHMLSKELQNFIDEFDFIAVPKGLI